MPAPLLTFLKYIFLAVLYLFFVRVLRAVWIELREPKVVALEPTSTSPPPSAPSLHRHPEPAFGAAASGDLTNTGLPAPAPGPTRLVVVAPPGLAGARFELGEETTVGRSPGCGVALPDDTFVSQVHARVFRRGGELFVEDLGSTNGTLVDQVAVSGPVPLRPGSLLSVGQTVLGLDQ